MAIRSVQEPTLARRPVLAWNPTLDAVMAAAAVVTSAISRAMAFVAAVASVDGLPTPQAPISDSPLLDGRRLGAHAASMAGDVLFAPEVVSCRRSWRGCPPVALASAGGSLQARRRSPPGRRWLVALRASRFVCDEIFAMESVTAPTSWPLGQFGLRAGSCSSQHRR
ncbi:MAG: hypothetical protein IPI48_03605 [bacterium]|nr:hypothetical protein [bacterium]